MRRVSVGVPVFNGEKYLDRCLASLRAQTHDDLEILVADNASTDASVEIAEAHAAADERIRVIHAPENRGAAFNYNRVVELTSAPFFCWSPHDDEREPTAIEHCIASFDEHGPDAVLVHNRGVFIDEASEVVGVDDDHFEITDRGAARRLVRALHNLNVANPVLGVMRRSALERTRLIGPFPASDYVLLAELAMLGTIIEIDDLGFRRRIHPESSRKAATTKEAVQAWFDPSQRSSALSDRSRLLLEYHRSAMTVPPGLGARISCSAAIVPARATKRARILLGRLKTEH